ncbi:MAG: DNA repair protein RecO [Gammaproteobacteria bacterium]
MRIVLQPAFILHRRAYRDTSLLIDVFSRDGGRLALVGRGARASKSRWAGVLQPFRPLLLSWSGKGEVKTLSAAEEAGSAILLPVTRVLSGLYLNELLLRLLARYDPHPGIFAAYRMVLAELANTDADEEAALRRFEKCLLAEIGYGLRLDREADTHAPIQPDRLYRYLPNHGAVAIAGTGGEGVVISGASLLALHSGQLAGAESLREAKRLTRAALAICLEGRPLKTRELMIATQQRLAHASG